MRKPTRHLIYVFGLLMLATLACKYSFTTANISSLKISKEKSASSEDSTFDTKSTIYVVAQVSNTSDKHKVTIRLTYDDVSGQKSGELVPGTETTVEVPGAAAATFTLTAPSSGWPGGKYKVEVTMKNEDGKQIDQKTATLTVSGSNQNTASESASPTNSGATPSAVKLTSIQLDSTVDYEPGGTKTTFSPSDTIYVFYTIEGATPSMKVYCNLYTEDTEGIPPETLHRALSYMNPRESVIIDRFDLNPKKEEDGQTIWASGTFRIEISYVSDTQTSPQMLKTIKFTVR